MHHVSILKWHQVEEQGKCLATLATSQNSLLADAHLAKLLVKSILAVMICHCLLHFLVTVMMVQAVRLRSVQACFSTQLT